MCIWGHTLTNPWPLLVMECRMTNISAFHIRTAFHMRKMTNIGISDYGGLQNGQEWAFWAVQAYKMAIYIFKVYIWGLTLANPWHLSVTGCRMTNISAFHFRTPFHRKKLPNKMHFGLYSPTKLRLCFKWTSGTTK